MAQGCKGLARPRSSSSLVQIQRVSIHHPGQGLQADHAGLQSAHHLQVACSGMATVGLQKIFRVSYRIRLLETDEGWSVSCLDLPGCHSQGETREEALQNIREAIGLWLEVEAEESGVKRVETLELAI